jgi:TolB-like protein/Flp pilus assembly protein TadD
MQIEAAVSPLPSSIGYDDALRVVESDAAEIALEPLIREELARILRSRIFSLSRRMKRFLRFVVETTLEGRADYLKEYVIGTEVYDRKPPYEPSQDSIVRTEARRLRSKLKEYYESEGKMDPLFIGFRAGSYVPVFAPREQLNPDRPHIDRASDFISSESPKTLIVVTQFNDVSGDILAKDCARALSEGIALQLMTIEKCRVINAAPAWQSGMAPWEESKVRTLRDPHLVIQGTVARNDRWLRVTVRLGDPDGFQLWSMQLDLEAERRHLFGLINQIASAIMSRMRLDEFSCRGATLEERASNNYIYGEILTTENLMNQDSSGGWLSIQIRLESLLRSAPNQPRVHSDIAHCLVEGALSGISESSEAVSQAKCAILRALEHDARLSSGHACLGLILALENDFAGAQRSFERSWIRGSGATGHAQFALLLAALGRFEEAHHHLSKAQAMDPFSSRQRIARSRILYISRDFEELVRDHEGLSIYGSTPAESQCITALAYLELGRAEEARELARRIRLDAQSHPQLMASVAEIWARCGDSKIAIEIIENLKLFAGDSPISSLRQALLASALGDERGALDALITSYEKREAELLWVGVDPRFDLIRDCPCVRSLDVWHQLRNAKLANVATDHLFPRYSCLDEFSDEPRVA